ncbi:MAG: hypothetical protein ABSF75_01490, partial [Terracidiphilus sp.]
MAMFTPRALQSAINGSLTYANKSKRMEWIGVLNSPRSPKYIPAEWEIMLLRSLSELGSITHELNLGGQTKPDVQFQSPSVAFVADIATISDRGPHERN